MIIIKSGVMEYIKPFKHFLPIMFLVIYWLIPFLPYSQVVQKWVSRYNGIKNDYPVFVAVDKFGNVYTTGISAGTRGLEVVTIKYDSNAVQQWVQHFENADNEDLTSPLAIDDSGNVYIIANYFRSGSEYLTIKYNSSGVQQWAQTYNGAVDGEDRVYALGLDKKGNAYVTGTSLGKNRSQYDYATIKYSSTGIQQWVQRYDGQMIGLDGRPFSLDDHAYALAVDDSGNVYVTGSTVFSGRITNQRYVTIKYNTDSVQQWISVSSDGNGGFPRSMVLDGKGNIYITGGGASNTTAGFYTTKYTTNGVQQWERILRGSFGEFDFASSIAVDSFGNVFVKGTTRNVLDIGIRYHRAIVKYNSNGVGLWAQYFVQTNSYDKPNSMAVDKTGNVYITDLFMEGRAQNIITIKYDTSGKELWRIAYDGPSHSFDAGYALALDSFNNIYVTGPSINIGTATDFVTIKYTQTSSPNRNGVCCFTGPSGQKAVCGPRVTAIKCESSGQDAFFAGTVVDCSVIDTSTICSRTTSNISLEANYVESDNTVLLSWQLGTDHRTTGYYIQRSKDGSSFKTIGFMPVNTTGNYNFTDNYPLLEGYYKLVWFERQGYESNKVLAIAISSTKMELVPNPANDKVQILIRDIQNYETKIMIYDNTGRLVLRQRLAKGQSPEINISGFASGTYYIRAEMNGKVYNEKLLKK